MFSHPTKEAASGRIEISDVDPAVFEQLLIYIYTGFAPRVDCIAEELLIAANKVVRLCGCCDVIMHCGCCHCYLLLWVVCR